VCSCLKVNRQALVRNSRSDYPFPVGYTAAPQLLAIGPLLCHLFLFHFCGRFIRTKRVQTEFGVPCSRETPFLRLCKNTVFFLQNKRCLKESVGLRKTRTMSCRMLDSIPMRALPRGRIPGGGNYSFPVCLIVICKQTFSALELRELVCLSRDTEVGGTRSVQSHCPLQPHCGFC